MADYRLSKLSVSLFKTLQFNIYSMAVVVQLDYLQVELLQIIFSPLFYYHCTIYRNSPFFVVEIFSDITCGLNFFYLNINLQ